MIKKITALLLCLIMALSCFSTTVFAKKELTPEELELKGQRISTFLDFLLNDVLLTSISRIIPRMSFVVDDTDEFDTENFYEGSTSIISTDSDNYTWNIGYGKESIIPDDFGKKLKYARGSYCPWGYSTGFYKDDDGNDETMNVRTVILDDNTGRGSEVICSVDCIGISNADVKKIRAALADFAKEKNIVSIDISSIHSHQAIDSQGVWGAPLTTIINNNLSLLGITKSKFGVNKDYLDTIINSTKASVIEAYNNMKPGKLSYATVDLEEYMGTRTVSAECDDDLHRLIFTPDDGSNGIVMASFGAHPEATSYGAEFCGDLSADFVYYMEKLINKSGNDFIYIQGNVGTNSCWRGKSNDGLDLPDNHATAMRYGYEMAYICLGASMTREERIELNDRLGDILGVNTLKDNEGYTVWYDDLATAEEIPVEAVLNIKHKQVKLEIENGTALVLLKLGLASNAIAYNSKNHKYYTTTEIGYMELGNAVKAVLSPGEMYSELLVGGYGLRYSDYKSLRESYGENVILFDLMNDAAGYICPDETYYILGKKYNPASGELETDSWCLAVSIGQYTASTLMEAYSELIGTVK